MTQNEFFNIIMDELKELPELKLQEIISQYKNKISDGILHGKNEDEIIADFGDPYLICYNYKNNNSDHKIVNKEGPVSSVNLKKTSANITSYRNKSDINYILPIDCIKNDKRFDETDNKNNISIKLNNSSPHVDKFLKICIIILSLIIFFPFITSTIGIIIGVLGIALSLLVGSVGLIISGTFTNLIGMPHIPQFIANFPYPVIVLFALGTICLSIFLLFIFYYSCKFLFRLCRRLLNFLKSKGGIFYE